MGFDQQVLLDPLEVDWPRLSANDDRPPGDLRLPTNGVPSTPATCCPPFLVGFELGFEGYVYMLYIPFLSDSPSSGCLFFWEKMIPPTSCQLQIVPIAVLSISMYGLPAVLLDRCNRRLIPEF